MSSVNHADQFAHLKIPLENVLSATNNFDDENVIEKADFGNAYAGQLLWSGELIEIDVRRFNKQWDGGEQEFWMEISMLSSLKHQNLVSLVGFCYENDEKIIIIRRETGGSLELYLSDPLLTWVRRLEICVGLANALSYIHYDEARAFSVIHRNIDSLNVLLNGDYEPKLCEFRLSVKIKASERHLSFDTEKVCNTPGYTDPTYLETKSASHKSDMYSFGIVMFELLCGRKAVINDDQYNKYLAPVAITHYRKEKLHEIIDWNIWKQMAPQSFDIFSKTAYDCLNDELSQRPNIDEIVPRLEKALELQLEHQDVIMSKEFAHLKVPLEDILSATNNFAEENVIHTSEFEKRYGGQLVWSGELIEIRARRWLNKERDDEKEQQFWMEISLLSSLKHKNLVSLVGLCIENDENIIINRREIKGSLCLYLSDPVLLTWVRRLEICVGIAHALSYIHHDKSRDFSVIHRCICSASVILNDDWEPKLSDFEFSMKVKAFQRHHSFHTNKLQYELGYGDPTYVETKSVNHKSDIYSFGIVLFELLCGMRSISEHPDNKYLATLAIFHYKKKILDEIIDPVLRKQMDPQSLNVFAQTAYECLNEDQSQRPNIDEIVTRLENALKLQMERQNAEHSIVAAEVEDTLTSHDKESVTFKSTGVESHVDKNTMSSLKDVSHFKLNFEDVESATNNFAAENIIEEFKLGIIYKGRLLQSEQFIDIIVKRFDTSCIKDENKKIWTEISMLSSLKHKNIMSLIGFCDMEYVKMIIYKAASPSLKTYLSDQTLTWMQRLKICVGVANALSYLHYDPGRDFSVIHCNIRSSTILLDDKWEPKLSGFELSLKNTVARRQHLLFTRDIGKNVYLDPKYRKTGGVTHKSDVYSFGVVLFEVLRGRSALDEDNLGEGLISQLEKSHMGDMVDPHLRKQMDPESFRIFSDTAYYCLQEERAKRPYIDQVVKRLDKALELQRKHENPELPKNAVDGTSSNYLTWKNMEHLKIGLNDIELATENFADTCCIGSGGYGIVYKAQLEHFDSSTSSSVDGENECDLPKKRSTVAIKRIFNTQGEQGFTAEIKTLTSCKHENIISLLGFCDEDRDHLILVYELASKGSLEDYLGNSEKITNLTWMQRLKICLDIAHGLKYIHTNTDQDKQKIIHRDIKSANILLDDNWKAKIADFGLSKFHPADQDASTFDVSTIAELATENFADKHCIGSGGYGIVYKAQLEHFDSSTSSSVDGENKCDLPKKRSTVAIKRIFNTQGEQGFDAEIKTLTSCKHENIISLLGFCDEDRDHLILVYELASKGSLEDYLGNSEKITNLTWMQRLKICLDIAHGLKYIHTNTDQDKQKIIHRDIKSANILLDDNWKAKIADFGLSKFHPADQDASTFDVSTIAGTPMYFDPEYEKSGKLNKKSDIYSFGVVLFEILTGRLAYDFDKGIAPVARQHFEKGTLMEIVDRKIKEETDEHVFSLSKGPDKESLDIFSEIAFRCLAETQVQRPTIDVVINELKRAINCQVSQCSKDIFGYYYFYHIDITFI
ncbi:protein kinase-like domain, Concanavalin A-like lectin/glucanase domain protein [Artemisia annua]|uniref:non-specific serine/threonine protein kinase n=1 Tax=Artemisia annua TaxID=35608 RepID=A0A2U1P6J1_ARTAN|nr:protein kinase-like domain, Concanavalin A-like lectin/glucanase domain protein [Artemisia annua]